MSKKYTLTITKQDVENFNNDYFKNHPKAKNKRIARPTHPSLNSYLNMKNIQRNVLKQDWSDLITICCNEQNLCNLSIQKCIIIHKSYFPTKAKHDYDNFTPKFHLDPLTKNNVIVDDNSNIVVKLILEHYYDKENERTEIEIQIVD